MKGETPVLEAVMDKLTFPHSMHSASIVMIIRHKIYVFIISV